MYRLANQSGDAQDLLLLGKFIQSLYLFVYANTARCIHAVVRLDGFDCVYTVQVQKNMYKKNIRNMFTRDTIIWPPNGMLFTALEIAFIPKENCRLQHLFEYVLKYNLSFVLYI